MRTVFTPQARGSEEPSSSHWRRSRSLEMKLRSRSVQVRADQLSKPSAFPLGYDATTCNMSSTVIWGSGCARAS
eukprot:4222210-Amphidinium_carterae.2